MSLAHEVAVVPVGADRKRSQMLEENVAGLLLRLALRPWHRTARNLWRIPWPEGWQNLLIPGPGDGVLGYGFARQSVLGITFFSLVLV